MRIHVNTQELNAGIATVIRALSARTTVSILEGTWKLPEAGCCCAVPIFPFKSKPTCLQPCRRRGQ